MTPTPSIPIYLCQRGRIIFLRNRPGRQLSSRRHLCGSHLARREAGRSPCAVSDEIRAVPQSQDRQGAWPCGTAIDSTSRRRGDRVGGEGQRVAAPPFATLCLGECLYRVCAVTRRRFPVGASPTRRTLQPEAAGAAMEVTK